MKDAMQELWSDVICLVDLAAKKRAFDLWKRRWIIEIGTATTASQYTIVTDPNVDPHIIKNMENQIKKAFIRLAEIEFTKHVSYDSCQNIYQLKTQIISKHPQCKKEN